MRFTRNIHLKDYLTWYDDLETTHLPAMHKWNLLRLSKILVQNIMDSTEGLRIIKGYVSPEIAYRIKEPKSSQFRYGEACLLHGPQEEIEKGFTFAKVVLAPAVGECAMGNQTLYISLPDHEKYGRFRDLRNDGA